MENDPELNPRAKGSPLGPTQMKNYYVYFLLSLRDNNFYIGCTNIEPEKRLAEYHNKGIVKSTKPRIPFLLAYYEAYKDKNLAYKKEFYLKNPKGYKEKIEIISLI